MAGISTQQSIFLSIQLLLLSSVYSYVIDISLAYYILPSFNWQGIKTALALVWYNYIHWNLWYDLV